jgi:hypothetical protein
VPRNDRERTAKAHLENAQHCDRKENIRSFGETNPKAKRILLSVTSTL